MIITSEAGIDTLIAMMAPRCTPSPTLTQTPCHALTHFGTGVHQIILVAILCLPRTTVQESKCYQPSEYCCLTCYIFARRTLGIKF